MTLILLSYLQLLAGISHKKAVGKQEREIPANNLPE
jgi:hypothetical protein